MQAGITNDLWTMERLYDEVMAQPELAPHPARPAGFFMRPW